MRIGLPWVLLAVVGCHKTTPVAEAKPDPWAVPAAVSLSLPHSASTDVPTAQSRLYVTASGQVDRSAWKPDVPVLIYADATTTLRLLADATAAGGSFELAVAGPGGVRVIPLPVKRCQRVRVLGALNPSDVPPVDLNAIAAGSAGVHNAAGDLHIAAGDGPVTAGKHQSLALLGATDAAATAATPAATAPPCPSSTIDLTVLIVHDGISIKASGGNVAPGCNDVGPGLAIPDRDMHALRACLVKLHGKLPFVGDEPLTLTGSRDTPVQTLVDVLDAARLDDTGKALFTSVQLAAPL